MDEVKKAWQKAQEAWVAAGRKTPCYDPAYMAARKELLDAHLAQGRKP